jgi:hypothetical protein
MDSMIGAGACWRRVHQRQAARVADGEVSSSASGTDIIFDDGSRTSMTFVKAALERDAARYQLAARLPMTAVG